MIDLIVPDQCYEWLRYQNGDIYDEFEKGNNQALCQKWKFKYQACLPSIRQIRDRYMGEPKYHLDIAGGLSTFSIFLHKDNKAYTHTILDGNVEQMTIDSGKARYLYSNKQACLDYLHANGVDQSQVFYVPVKKDEPKPQAIKDTYHLITSFAGWPFHIPIDTYIDYVKGSLLADGVLICETRNDTLQHLIMKDHFHYHSLLGMEKKKQLWAFWKPKFPEFPKMV